MKKRKKEGKKERSGRKDEKEKGRKRKKKKKVKERGKKKRKEKKNKIVEGKGMVGIENVEEHWNTKQLTAEVV
ncbi:hypothetical protein, partial [Acinetobacter pittii]|uniref:hypothetical protein n=1 Tax=Acinetobacter pittii TaxID=48296 RepID=UPI00227C7616